MIVGCLNCCHPKLFEVFDDLNIETIPGTLLASDFGDDLETCSKCNSVLLSDDHVIIDKDDFLAETTDLLAEKINDEITECQSCNDNIILYKQRTGEQLDLNTIGELVSTFNLPKEIESFVYEKIQCRCGNSLNSDDPYVTKEELNDWFGEEIDFVINTFDISAEDTQDFIKFLQDNPMLGLEHKVGKTILKKIKEETLDEIEVLEEKLIFYRGRKRNKYERLVPFIEDELWHPPLGLPKQGRYNPPGVAYLYLADSTDVVINEIAPSNNDIVEIGELETLKPLKVFNSTKADIDIFAALERDDDGHVFAYEYIFPNFLSQCLAYCNFNGILYQSIKSNTGVNLCLFNFKQNIDIKMKAVHVDVKKKTKNPFIDLPF
ncbi:TPA: RES domain-containing protein [Bacillus cereus]|uniref:RES family NAD+ phosphorylase n=1 Tax=Bacillus thuringiensis TaxID=1428 RepID=UPI000BF9109C|nr:RES family NAD+ phosphorylase [Bacillus thuringiensis]HDR8128227.1 RES domain-containing protein [Bacillus cereus]MED2985155.1 RES family NAD+ phosphorylase [Bacillus thuringiensis]MRB56228.1 RES domain-containing protein [Bacillus thuringiensis]PFU71783.1 hypothetical protein COK95_07370 [Bacillus thuringiensis]HDR8492565.1 RES domain-containing protein [Bacillus cereus]